MRAGIANITLTSGFRADYPRYIINVSRASNRIRVFDYEPTPLSHQLGYLAG